jgi:hypothetical protein
LLKDIPHHALSGEDFADAVETLIINARAKGLSDTTLLVEIEDIAGQLREALDGPPHGGDRSRQLPLSRRLQLG